MDISFLPPYSSPTLDEEQLQKGVATIVVLSFPFLEVSLILIFISEPF